MLLYYFAHYVNINVKISKVGYSDIFASNPNFKKFEALEKILRKKCSHHKNIKLKKEEEVHKAYIIKQ